MLRNCKACRELEDVATDQQTGGLAVSLIIDRATASRLGIAPATIDNTLYDAFGQRQINTMYTQLNQYHVILETEPQFQQNPNTLQNLYIQANARREHRGRELLLRSRLPVGLRRIERDHRLRAVYADRFVQHSRSADECACGELQFLDTPAWAPPLTAARAAR